MRLATHPKWEVRGAIALALEELRHDTFLPTLATLLRDENATVRKDAERTRARRSERTKSDFLSDEHAELLADSFTDLERNHGRKARDAALRVAEHYVSLHMREAYHEIFRAIQPMNANLVLLNQRLQKEPFDLEAARRNIRTAQRRAKFALQMIQRIKEFNTQVTLQFESQSVRAILKESAALVRERFTDKRSKVKVEIVADPKLRVEADHARLVAAFSNLIQNSFEAFDGVHRPHRVCLEARAERKDWIVVTFTDNGSGIEEENLAVAFKLFRTTKAQGTGVGLSLAKKIVESEHGGAIRIDSVEGKSTTVTVTLPREQETR